MTEREFERIKALFEYEKEYHSGDFSVAGMDEVGRGPLAGPVTVACVSLPCEPLIEYVNDSKKVTEKRRPIVAEKIREIGRYSIVSIDNNTIDEINILNATKMAMRKAASEIDADYKTLFVDAVELAPVRDNTEVISVIKGDAKVYSIAAASILAKVTRDLYMIEMDEVYPEYGFARNKGYGTQEHIAALKKYGPCPIHRQSFIKGILGIKDTDR